MTKITPSTPLQQLLIDNGYKKYVCLSYLTYHSTDTLYQKLIEDNNGKRYYINAWYYPYKEWPQGGITQEAIQVEVQFRNQDGDCCLNVSPLTGNDFTKAEEIIARIWVSEGCGYYERREDY